MTCETPEPNGIGNGSAKGLLTGTLLPFSCTIIEAFLAAYELPAVIVLLAILMMETNQYEYFPLLCLRPVSDSCFCHTSYSSSRNKGNEFERLRGL
jgi:hypothetical protein